MSTKAIVYIILVVGLIIILDELAFNLWKFSNPGAQWSRAAGEVAPLVNPNEPPRSWG